MHAIVLPHAHWDHVLALPDVADALGVPVLAHPAQRSVWGHECDHLHEHGHFEAGTATEDLRRTGGLPAAPADRPLWDGTVSPLHDGDTVRVGDRWLTAVHTPGHTPGGLSLVLGGHVLTGDTLFPGGPGLTGWPLSDFPAIIASIRDRLFTLPDATDVHPGHGRSTTIGSERPSLDDWVRRGW